MASTLEITQTPAPGKKCLKFRGDLMTFGIRLSRPVKGTAALRTNLGQGAIARREYINRVDLQVPNLGRDWFDVPMIQTDASEFKVSLPLTDIGHFEAKAFFLPQGRKTAVWMPGPNVAINIEPAETCCGNIIYNAFVRQFGLNKDGSFFRKSREACVKMLDDAGYVVIPPSGTFRDFIKELDFIIGELGCRWIQLLPIHTTPTTYGRMGRFGSPYAALSFTAVDPALAEFDSKATPLEQFVELVDAIHARNANILLDIAINHTGWAARLHETHPQWLVRSSEGKIEVPGAWGVRWEDLTRLDYQKKDLWHYMAGVFLTWCRRGVDGFRCDAGYMIPVEAWRYIIAEVREQFPNTIFFLEGLGGKISVTRELLNTANFNWTYSELFQNYDRGQIEQYLPETMNIASGEGMTVHYAETHDNPRLASRSLVWAKMRTALCALCSYQGGFGFANGVEWYATEKINVHESPSLNWRAEPNQVQHIKRLAAILKIHPAFHDRCHVRLVAHQGGNTLILYRRHRPTKKQVLIVANLDDSAGGTVSWFLGDTPLEKIPWVDLITGKEIRAFKKGERVRLNLEAGEVLCLTDCPDDLSRITASQVNGFEIPERILRQRLRAKALDVFQCTHPFGDLSARDLEKATDLLQQDPVEFCRQENPDTQEPRVITWVWPQDRQRQVLLPPKNFLLVRAPRSFRVQLSQAGSMLAAEMSVPGEDGSHWALITATHGVDRRSKLKLGIVVFWEKSADHTNADVLVLSSEAPVIRSVYQRKDWEDNGLRTIATNEAGAMALIPVEWGNVLSRYDTLLGANLHARVPVDRWITLTRCRAWVVYQDYSQEVNTHCLEKFVLNTDLTGTWIYRIPIGRGKHILLSAQVTLDRNTNRVNVLFERKEGAGGQGYLPDAESVDLILRPDIENRSYHEVTKAYLGPEHDYPAALQLQKNGFRFQPGLKPSLMVSMPQSEFVRQPEWHYMVYHPEDEQRGFDPHGDLFSPGYFKLSIEGAGRAALHAEVSNAAGMMDDAKNGTAVGRKVFAETKDVTSGIPLETVLRKALGQFIVRRESLKTVIAGYPWFLDWGRDAIIVSRGVTAMGDTDTAANILTLFGQFEENGTLPNMLHGENAANRDTSDAPLWFIVASRDIVEKEKNDAWLNTPCGSRTIRQILYSIVQSYMEGTPNGIRMDSDTGLIYSPSHFTWMDTDHPAGTPREGYPIEIQALWCAALDFFSRFDKTGKRWAQLRDKVRHAIDRYFRMPSSGYLADCLCADATLGAKKAEQDDALRPNQLFAITMGAVEDKMMGRSILDACQTLLVPGAIRSLADQRLQRPLPIVHEGKLVNDPYQPYRGRYQGDEDTSRKPAYHNGTAWTWPFPSYCEAWARVYGRASRPTALAWLGSMRHLLEHGCIGQIPEIVDGDFPHTQRGCPAQAWGVSEALRVWIMLKSSRR
jgi:starch synthase (maltosyl-transferring)